MAQSLLRVPVIYLFASSVVSLFAMRTGREVKPPSLAFHESVRFAYDTFSSDKVRFLLTTLGMVVGTASLILVVTILITGKQYVLEQIQGIGVNMIVVEYQGGERGSDFLTLDDMHAALKQVQGIAAASPVVPLADRIPVGLGQERDLQLLGVLPDYFVVRNLVVLSGRSFDWQDEQARNKVGVITQTLAEQLYGSVNEAVGKVLKVKGLPFTIIGAFRERVNTFGRSEVTYNTMVIPYTVSRYFTESPEVKQIYFSAADPSSVILVTEQIQHEIQSRHRPESSYFVQNLTEVVAMASRTADALSLILLVIAGVTLLVSGIGIMNIMMATVNSRISEIGIRKAIGATNREIHFQFISEAMLISLTGGIAGVMIGLALPLSVRLFTDYRIPISALSVVVAIVVCSLVGIIFGTTPAALAAKLDPVESMRHE